jgi:hypothetical protein
MARNKQELAAAFDRILNSTSQRVDTVQKGQELRVAFANNLATEVDGYIQFQLSASFATVNARIDNLTTLVNQLRSNITGSSI